MKNNANDKKGWTQRKCLEHNNNNNEGVFIGCETDKRILMLSCGLHFSGSIIFALNGRFVIGQNKGKRTNIDNGNSISNEGGRKEFNYIFITKNIYFIVTNISNDKEIDMENKR